MSFEWNNIYRYEEEIDNRIAEEANEYVMRILRHVTIQIN
jgi:hypothetical protein